MQMKDQKAIKEWIRRARECARIWGVETPYRDILPSLIVSSDALIRVLEDLAELDEFDGSSERVAMWITTLADALKNIYSALKDMLPDIADDEFRAGVEDLVRSWMEITSRKPDQESH